MGSIATERRKLYRRKAWLVDKLPVRYRPGGDRHKCWEAANSDCVVNPRALAEIVRIEGRLWELTRQKAAERPLQQPLPSTDDLTSVPDHVIANRLSRYEKRCEREGGPYGGGARWVPVLQVVKTMLRARQLAAYEERERAWQIHCRETSDLVDPFKRPRRPWWLKNLDDNDAREERERRRTAAALAKVQSWQVSSDTSVKERLGIAHRAGTVPALAEIERQQTVARRREQRSVDRKEARLRQRWAKLCAWAMSSGTGERIELDCGEVYLWYPAEYGFGRIPYETQRLDVLERFAVRVADGWAIRVGSEQGRAARSAAGQFAVDSFSSSTAMASR